MHVLAGLAGEPSFPEAKAFSRRIAEDLASEWPERVLARSDREARAGRVYVDWIQNDRNRQLVAAYSPRATGRPGVSTPLTWDEVGRAADGELEAVRPTFQEVLARVTRLGDIWAALGQGQRRLPET